MIYLIGGVPRSGKTTLAQKLVTEKNIPFVPTDWIVNTLKHEVPDYKVTDEVDFREKADRFYPFLNKFLYYANATLDNYTIEGDSFLPIHASKFIKKYKAKTVFLGISDITLEKLKQNVGQNDWINDLPEEEQKELPKWLAYMSTYIEKECMQYGIKYIDMSTNFHNHLDKVYSYMFSQ